MNWNTNKVKMIVPKYGLEYNHPDILKVGQIIEYIRSSMFCSETVPYGFGTPHSYTSYGYYLGVTKALNTTSGNMIKCLSSSIGSFFPSEYEAAYKMDHETPVYLTDGKFELGVGISRSMIEDMILGKETYECYDGRPC